MRTEDWLKPLMLVVGIFAFVYFLMTLNTYGAFGTWDISSVISMIPWLVALACTLLTIFYLMRRQ